MREDNLIHLSEYREQVAREAATARNAQREAEHSEKAAALLEDLRAKKRVDHDDQLILVANLGQLVNALESDNPKALAKSILMPDHWDKRKRYIRLPSDTPNPSGRSAASGGTFAGIIDRLIEKKVRKGFDRTQAKIETVYGALKGTSFRRSPRYQIGEAIDGGDAAVFLGSMKKILDKLAHDADLPEYFQLVSKYPVYPNKEWTTLSSSLELKFDLGSNDLYRWDWYTDEEELQDWIPWWAPRCVIGHLYIPFRCGRLEVPPHGVTEIEKACGGKVRGGWRGDYENLVTPFISPEWIRPYHMHHRLPIWLIVLPLPNRLIPCLYAAIYRPIGFKPKEHSPSYDDPVLPCFVGRLGKQIEDDEVYFEATYGLDDYTTLYVSAPEAGIFVIGSGVEDMWNFKSELMCSGIDDLPEWLQAHPVQRLLKLTMDSDEAKQFSLSARSFAHTIEWSPTDDESASREELTIFRAAFPDPVSQCTPLRQNTIAAYLLRNFTVKGNSFFDALRDDALARAAPARELVDRELSKFHAAFDEQLGSSQTT